MQSRDVQRPLLAAQSSAAVISPQPRLSSQQVFEHDSVDADEGFQLIAPAAAAAASPSPSLPSSSISLSSSTPSLTGAAPAGNAAAKRKKRAGDASLAASVSSILHDRDGAGSGAILMSASTAEARDAEQAAAWATESHYAQYSDSSWSVEEHDRRPPAAVAAAGRSGHLAFSLGSSWSNSVTASQQLEDDDFDEAEQQDEEDEKGEDEDEPEAGTEEQTQDVQQTAAPAASASPRASSSVYPTLAAFTALSPLDGPSSNSAAHRSLQSYSIPALPAAFSALPHPGCATCGCAASLASCSSAASCHSSAASSSCCSCASPLFPYLSPVFLRRAGYVMSFLLFFSLVKLGVSYATRCCGSKGAASVAAAVSRLHS